MTREKVTIWWVVKSVKSKAVIVTLILFCIVTQIKVIWTRRELVLFVRRTWVPADWGSSVQCHRGLIARSIHYSQQIINIWGTSNGYWFPKLCFLEVILELLAISLVDFRKWSLGSESARLAIITTIGLAEHFVRVRWCARCTWWCSLNRMSQLLQYTS